MSKPITHEEVRRIVAGLAHGVPPGYRPMTDREWLRRTASDDGQEKQLSILEEIRDTLNAQRS